MNAPKSQITAEKKLITETGTNQEKKTERRKQEMVGGIHSQYNQIPYCIMGNTHNEK